jgi:hypothetical protein
VRIVGANAFDEAAMTGTTNRNTIVVPCRVSSWSYVCGESSVLCGFPSPRPGYVAG